MLASGLSGRLLADLARDLQATVRPEVQRVDAPDDLETPPAFFKDHLGQMEAWNAVERILAIFAGWQSGKTAAGPHLLLREVQRRGPDDYAVLAPSYPLLKNKALPELKAAFGPYVRHLKAENVLEVTEYGAMRLWGHPGTARILLRHCDDPDAVEAFTAAAIWADEPGQMKDEIWEAIQARVAVRQGRIILTSRPYRNNWYVTQIWNRRHDDPDIKVVNFRSIDNPAFPKGEYDRQRALMPLWKFRMKYDGIPTKPAGMVYDIVDRDRHGVARFEIPATWRRYAGIDFGNNNTAAIKVAEEKVEGAKPRYFVYGTYKPGERRTASGGDGHVAHIKRGEPHTPTGVGGSHQEDGWRESWASAGLPVKEPPVSKIDVQIERVYELFAEDRLFIFEDLADFWDELEDYSWPTDENGTIVKEDKPDEDQKYHLMAALRYLGSHLNPPKSKRKLELTMY